MDEAVLLIQLSDQTISLDYLPAYDTLLREINDVLPEPLPPYHLQWGDDVIVDSDEALSNVLERSEGPIKLTLVIEDYESPPNTPGHLRCTFCSTSLPNTSSACPRCKAESWDAFFLSRFGVDVWEAYTGDPAVSLSPRASAQGLEKGYESGDELDKEPLEDVVESPAIIFSPSEPIPEAVPRPEKRENSYLKPTNAAAEDSDQDYDSLPDSTRDFPPVEDVLVDQILDAGGYSEDNIDVEDVAEGQLVAEEPEKQVGDILVDNEAHHEDEREKEVAVVAQRSGILFPSPYYQPGPRAKLPPQAAPPSPRPPTKLTAPLRASAMPLSKPSPPSAPLHSLSTQIRLRSVNITPEKTVCRVCFRLVPWYFEECRHCEAMRSADRLKSVGYKLKVKAKFQFASI